MKRQLLAFVLVTVMVASAFTAVQLTAGTTTVAAATATPMAARTPTNQGADDTVTFAVTDEHGKVLQQAKPVKADKDAKPQHQQAKQEKTQAKVNGNTKATPVAAAAPTLQWTKPIGGTAFESASSVKQTSDGGYVLAGVSGSGGNGLQAYIVKLAKPTATTTAPWGQWSKMYGGASEEAARDIQQTSDGGYIVAGYSDVGGSLGYQYYLLKLDSAGRYGSAYPGTWAKTYGGPGEERAYSVQQTSDGGYVVVGFTKSLKLHGAEVYLLKVNAQGTVQWQKTYGGLKDDYATCVKQTADGGYIICGETKSWSSDGSSQGYLIKTDKNGDIMNAGTWEGTYVPSTYPTATFKKLVVKSDGYVVVGYNTNILRAQLWKITTSGGVSWTKLDNGATTESIATTSDGGYVIAGWFDGASAHNMYVQKTDAAGNYIWGQLYESPKPWQPCEGYSIVQTSDGGYAIAGTTTGYGNGYQAMLWKLAPG